MAEVYDDEEYIYDAVDAEEYDVEAEEVDALAALDDPRGFDALLRNVQATKDRDAPPPVRADLTRLPVVVDDYVRNFLVKHQLTETLNSFEQEWFKRSRGRAGCRTPSLVSMSACCDAKATGTRTRRGLQLPVLDRSLSWEAAAVKAPLGIQAQASLMRRLHQRRRLTS